MKRTAIWTGTALGASALVAWPLMTGVFASEQADLSIMDSKPSASDVLPAVVLDSDHQLRIDSARLVSSHDGVGTWVVSSENEEICLVVAPSEDVAGYSCTSGAEFNASGLTVQVWGAARNAVERYLVPDKVAGDSNVITIDPDSEDKESAIFRQLNSDAVQLGFRPNPIGPFKSPTKALP